MNDILKQVNDIFIDVWDNEATVLTNATTQAI